MHQYKIEVFKYNADGSLGERYETKYADTAEVAEMICREYDGYQTITDEEGNEVLTGNRKYKVNMYLLCYKLCADKDAFFAQFKA